MTHLPAVFFAVFWMFADLLGVLLSVISTYFYFGWEGVPLLVPKIFAIALLTFSAPTAYRLLLMHFKAASLQRGLLLLLFFMYLGLAVNRQSDFFAWGTVATTWVAGLALMAVLRTLGQYTVWSLPLLSLVLSLFFYLSTRIAQSGVPLILTSPTSLGITGWGTLAVFVLAGIFLPQRQVFRAESLTAPSSELSSESTSKAEPADKLPKAAGSLGLVFGLLSGLSVGLVANLHLWSAKTEPMPAAAYFLPLALGALLAWMAYSRLARPVLIVIGSLLLGAGLVPLLYTGYDKTLGLLACLGASLGLFSLWAVFLGRWRDYQQRQPKYFPWLGLQGGFIALLLILTMFLLKANPGGFWLALAGSAGLLLMHELKGQKLNLQATPLERLWYYSCGIFGVMGLAALFVPIPNRAVAADNKPEITVMSSNIRYGWTDDYRFDPMQHPRWLRDHTTEIMGLQEVNKGHTSGAYADDFRLYQKMIPGQWLYGDAHYGFGNALYTRYPVLKSEVRTYTAKDMLKRSCLITTLEIQGKPVDVYVTHLSHLAPPNPVREAQVGELIGWLKQSDKPWILIGDFNAEPDSPEIKQVQAISHPLLRKPDQYKIMSFPAAHPNRRIDYIFFSQDFELKKMEILNNGVTSDHRPIYAELLLE